MEFCLKRNTVCINIVDQAKGVEVKKVIFFGDIPANIRKIISSRNFGDGSEMKDYFGKRWREKLHIKYNTKSIKASLLAKKHEKSSFLGKTVHKGTAQTKASMARFSGEVEGGDEIPSNGKTVVGDETTGGFVFNLEKETEAKLKDIADVSEVNYDENITYVTHVILFPEDTVWTLREKIFLAIGIPIYRQYIYKRVKLADPTLHLPAHSILINETPYLIDTKNDTDLFNGINIDMNMYNNRENLRIKTKEPYKMIDSMLIDDIYLVDLMFYKRSLINLESILDSNYNSDVLYFGLFKKYFPLFDKEMMIKYFTNETEVFNEYPLINTPVSKLELKYETEKSILLDVYSKVDEYYNKFADDIELAVSEITYRLMDSYSVQNGIFIRNLVDIFPCDADHPFIECYNTKNNAKYRIVRSYKNQAESLIESILNDKNYKILDEISIYFRDKKFNQLNKFTINSNAIFTVTAKYLRSDAIDFSDSLDNISEYVNIFIDIINRNRKLVFNPNFTMTKIPYLDKTTTTVPNAKVSVKWNSIVTQQQFAHVNEVLQKFYLSGIAERRVLSTAVPNIVNVRMKKGINQKVNKFFLKKRVEVKNYYIIYHDIKSHDIWNNRYGGKHINIENNLTNVTFEFVNIANREFVRVINYILYVINEVSNNTIKKIEYAKDVGNAKKSAMKKMKSLDPKLYNFSVQNTNKSVKYSRICQKKFRPTNIYTKEEFDLMAKDRRDKLHQFINYTTGDPVWYECPKSLPYFGFITGKHPAGYCVPKCKVSETGGNKNKAIREGCTNKFSFDSVSSSTGLLKFGKQLTAGKVGFLHEKIYEMINLIAGNNDVHLFMKSVNPNYAGVLGSKIICCFAEQLGKTEQAVLQDCLDYIMKHKQELMVGVISDMLKGENNVLDDMTNNFSELLQQVYDVHIIYINVTVLIQNEILNSQNSTIHFSMDPSCSAYLSRGKNVRLVLIQRLYGNMYPVLYSENKLNKSSNDGFAMKLNSDKQSKEIDFVIGNYIGIYDSESPVVELLHKAIAKKIIRTEREVPNKPFTYSSLKDKLDGIKYTKYISSGKIRYLLAPKLCIGVSNSINIVESGIPESHDILVRKDLELPFSKLAGFLEHFRLPQVTIVVLKNDIYKFNDITDDDTAIGLRIDNINCWFNDIKVGKVKDHYPNADCIAMLFEPSDVNAAIAKRVKPKIAYMKDIEETYYNMYIYLLLKYEVYKYLLLKRNGELRSNLLKSIGKRNFIDEMNTIKQNNRDDYHKIMNIVNNSNNVESDLKKVLLNSDVEYIIDTYSKFDHKLLFNDITGIMKKITKPVGSLNGKVNNVIVSYIEYKDGNVEKISHDEDIFYSDNRIKVLDDKYDIFTKNIIDDIQNKLLFTYEMNNFNTFFVINYFHFAMVPGTTVHIQFL
jgi:hypothetical protein